MPRRDLVASLIEEADFSASLGETLHQIARRVERENFSPAGRKLVDTLMVEVTDAMRVVTATPTQRLSLHAEAASRLPAIGSLRRSCLTAGPELPAADRGAILALLGSAERAFVLIERIDAERRSVPRSVPTAQPAQEQPRAGDLGAAAAMPA